MTFKQILALCFLTTSLHTHMTSAHKPYYFTNDPIIENVAKVTIFTTLAASCGYALYKVGEWLFSKTDEQVVHDAQKYYHTTEQHYHSLMEVWQQEIYLSLEGYLERLPMDSSVSVNNSISYMQSAIKNLKKYSEQLQQRIDNMRYNDKKVQLKHRMKKLKNALDGLRTTLTPIYEFINKYKSYYLLKELMHSNAHYYAYEIQLLANPTNNESMLNKSFAAHIMSSKVKSKYPYITYIDKLSNKIEQLHQHLSSLTHSYEVLGSYAHQLSTQLQSIRSLVSIHAAYHNELAERERNRLQEERIAIEREKAAAQQAQAHALQEQNWLHLQEIYNQERILKELKKQNDEYL